MSFFKWLFKDTPQPPTYIVTKPEVPDYFAENQRLSDIVNAELDKIATADVRYRIKIVVAGEEILGEPIPGSGYVSTYFAGDYGGAYLNKYFPIFTPSKDIAFNRITALRNTGFFELNGKFYNVANISSIEVVPV